MSSEKEIDGEGFIYGAERIALGLVADIALQVIAQARRGEESLYCALRLAEKEWDLLSGALLAFDTSELRDAVRGLGYHRWETKTKAECVDLLMARVVWSRWSANC